MVKICLITVLCLVCCSCKKNKAEAAEGRKSNCFLQKTGEILEAVCDGVPMPIEAANSCTVNQTNNGAEIKCGNTSAQVRNGQDGGNQGPKGDPGPRGEKGDPGPPGQDGINGRDGTDGQPGAQGAQGIQGIQGPPGQDGRNGRTVLRSKECTFEWPTGPEAQITIKYKKLTYSDNYIEIITQLNYSVPSEASKFFNSALYSPDDPLRENLPIDIGDFQIKMLNENEALVRSRESGNFFQYVCSE